MSGDGRDKKTPTRIQGKKQNEEKMNISWDIELKIILDDDRISV